MKELTVDILWEEAELYFPRRVSSGHSKKEAYSFDSDITVSGIGVFPQFADWNTSRQNLPLYGDGNKAAWVMEDVLKRTLDLAGYLVQNGYPTKDVLAMLPRDFSNRISKRLR